MENRFRKVGDAALVAAVRRGDTEAIDEFLGRFQEVVMSQAKLLRVPPVEWRSWTSDLLCDVVVVSLGNGREPSLGFAYLITSARNRIAPSIVSGHCHQRASTSGRLPSEARSACWPPHAPSSAFVRRMRPLGAAPLRRYSTAGPRDGALITPEERRLLSWVAQRTSFSTIARMLGEHVNHREARDALRAPSSSRAALRRSLATRERAELVRFLRRTGAYDAAALDALARGECQMKEYPMRQTRPRRRGEEPIDDIAR